jgi:hypothetical protein
MHFRTILITALLAAGAAAAVPRDAAWVEDRVQAWQPTERERRWEQVGWAKDIRSAIQLGRQHKRPVFLFTLDGRMNVGRC